ncbi:uncharacterized protein isoform X1 [Musca autumnalis]|uniref:uncharacterized protein isoform X1 n=1 Tax=Musca autumnalis TaxID=221902 RepID=UPI003CF3A2A1
MLPSNSSSNTSTMMTPAGCHQRRQQQYHQQQQEDLYHHRRHRQMATFYGPNRWLWTAVLFGLLIVTVSAKDENSLKPSPASTLSSSQSPRDEIYIDDEGLDGSGHGGPHDDLEKDHDFSGSGFGPDDEDSDSDYHHHSHTHTQTGKSNINKQQIDDNDFITTSRNNNQNSHHQTSSGTNIGSGITNHQGNTGIISSVGSSAGSGGSTGLNTIDKNHTPVTATTTTTTTSTSKIIPPSTHHHSDGDDFDLDGDLDEDEGPLLHHSGDGGLIDSNVDYDDDHTGDDDDEHREITKVTYPSHGDKPKPHDEHKPVLGSKDENDDDFGEIDVDAGQSIDEDRNNNNEDDIDENDHHKNDDDDDDDDGDYDATKTKEDDDNSPIYTDITDPNETDSSSSSSTSTTTTTDKQPGGINTQGGTNIHDLDTNSINSLQPETKVIDQTTGNEVLIMNANDDDRTASFFAQPGILAAVIGGAVVGLLCAILVVMFIVYRMRKKDEGSYALDEPKRSPAMNSYAKNATNREFFA